MLRCNKHVSVSSVRWKKCRSLASCCKGMILLHCGLEIVRRVHFWSTPWHRRLKPMWISHYINCLWRSLIFEMILSLDNIQLKTGDSTFVVFRFYIEYFFIINIGTLSGAYLLNYNFSLLLYNWVLIFCNLMICSSVNFKLSFNI